MKAKELTFAESGAQGEFIQRVQPVGAGGVEELAGLGCGERTEAPGLVRGGLDVAGDVAGQFAFADGVFQCRLEHRVHVGHGQSGQLLLAALADGAAPLPFGVQALGAALAGGAEPAVGERVWWSLFQEKPRPLEGGVWKWPWITDNRIGPVGFRGVDLTRIVVAVDHAGGADDVNDETGLVAAGRTADGHMYVVADESGRMGADTWGHKTCRLALKVDADAIIVENNFGGDMAKQIVTQAWKELAEKGETKGRLMPAIIEVHAKQGKRLRAEPIAQLYAQGLVHHVGEHPRLEGQLVTWIPGMDSPDRMDAAVHALTELADPAAALAGTGAYDDQRLAGRR